MTPEAAQLRDYMSELSEEAYCAGWMQDVEYELWKVMLEGTAEYGRLSIGKNEVDRLLRLSTACHGWIFFDDDEGECWIRLDEWKIRYQAWSELRRGSP